MAVRASGACLCGAVQYRVHGPLRDVVFCHCSRCRRTHGHFAAYTACARGDLELVEARGLRWYESDGRRRGFCTECGASVFWEREESPTISISAGTARSDRACGASVPWLRVTLKASPADR